MLEPEKGLELNIALVKQLMGGYTYAKAGHFNGDRLYEYFNLAAFFNESFETDFMYFT